MTKLDDAIEAANKNAFPVISSNDLDNTGWGRSLINEFGRVTAEKIALFLNKNGLSFRIPLNLPEIDFGNVKLVFVKSGSGIRCKAFVNNKYDHNINSVEIPKISTRKLNQKNDFKITINYRFRTVAPINEHDEYVDEDLETLNFDEIYPLIKDVDSLTGSNADGNEVFDSDFKDKMKRKIIAKYLIENDMHIEVDKVLELIDAIT